MAGAVVSGAPSQKSSYYRVYEPARSPKPGRDPAPHQTQALGEMERWYEPGKNLGGILVLPTGGGKTFVATRFMCRNPLSDGYRVLWLAHTHHLLEQALGAFNNAMSFVRSNRVRVRVVSGAVEHFSPPGIRRDDDVLLCSLQAATRALKAEQPNFMEFLDAAKAGAGLFVVFDEAHHAPAPTYRRLLTRIGDICKPFGLLGLTATPTYSIESKRGWLKKLFPQGIVAQADAVELMANGILARPIPEDVRTEVKPEFDEDDYQKWVSTHRDLPPQIISSLAENRPRNDSIVGHYIKNKEKYGKTIMFADRWLQCEQLQVALNERGVRADAVYSHVEPRGRPYRPRREENAVVIERFKKNELDVLINVRMLTEGTDVPDAQTVFLTRQTTSEILLKQMVGRALRGPKFGGTKDAFIVSFIDNWKQHIDWATYDQIGRGGIDGDGKPKYDKRQAQQLISIELVRRLARQMDTGLNINPAPYTTLMPVGWYLVKYVAAVSDDAGDGSPGEAVADDTETVRRLIMVYDRDRERFERFISKLQDLCGSGGLQDFERSDLKRSKTLDERLEGWRDEVFGGDDDRPRKETTEHLLDLARHVARHGEPPDFFPFNEREKYNLDDVASSYIDQKLDPCTVDERLREEHAKDTLLWRIFYDEYDWFKSAYDACVNRILSTRRHGSDPDGSEPGYTTPEDIPEPGPSDETKKKVKIRDGYCCLCCGGKNRGWLEVDHIIPKYRKVDHRPENLQTLCRDCNRQKSDETIDFRRHRTKLTRSPGGLPDGRPPDGQGAEQAEQWARYLRRTVNFFYRCSAVKHVYIGTGGVWFIRLFRDDKQAWLRRHLPELAKRIRQARVDAGLGAVPERIEIWQNLPYDTMTQK